MSSTEVLSSENVTVPKLQHGEGSWVCTMPGGAYCYETFVRKNAEKAAARGWRVETIGTYLDRINEQAKATP